MKYLLMTMLAVALWFAFSNRVPTAAVIEPPIGSHLKASIDRTHQTLDQVQARNRANEF